MQVRKLEKTISKKCIIINKPEEKGETERDSTDLTQHDSKFMRDRGQKCNKRFTSERNEFRRR